MSISLEITQIVRRLFRAVSLAALSLSCGIGPVHAQESKGTTQSPDDSANNYVLSETYYVGASAGVLREKTVTTRYDLTVTAGPVAENGGRDLNVRVNKVTVKVDVPAQKRKGAFDSSTDKTDMKLTSFELLRPVSLVGCKLSFHLGADGNVQSVKGLDAVQEKLGNLFDANFRGTEVDQYARDLELDHVGESLMKEEWGSLLQLTASPSAQPTDPSQAAFHIDAAVPSEIWITPLDFACPLTSESSKSGGTTVVRRTGDFKTDRAVKTKIGPCDWSYQVTEGTFESMSTHDDTDQLLSAARRISADVDSTIAISGKDVHLDMTVRHDWKLKKADPE